MTDTTHSGPAPFPQQPVAPFKITAALRRRIAERDGWVCRYCLSRIRVALRRLVGSRHCATVDHSTPVSRGGGHEDENLAATCWWCNHRKGTRTHDEYVDALIASEAEGTRI